MCVHVCVCQFFCASLYLDEVRGGAGLQVGRRRGGGGGRKRRAPALGRDDPPSSRERQGEEQPELEIDSELDRDLENKSRQHKLTSANVRSIIHVSPSLLD